MLKVTLYYKLLTDHIFSYNKGYCTENKQIIFLSDTVTFNMQGKMSLYLKSALKESYGVSFFPIGLLRIRHSDFHSPHSCPVSTPYYTLP